MRWILGTAQFLPGYGVSGNDFSSTWSGFQSVVDLVENVGFDAFDTAPGYGRAESVIGEIRSSFKVHTKLDPRVAPEESLQRSVRLLRGKKLEVVYLHDPSEFMEATPSKLRRLREVCQTFDAALGVSIYETEEFERAVEDDNVDFVQVPLNVLDRRFNADVVDRARVNGVRVIARSTLLQGVLVSGPEQLPSRVEHLRRWIVEFQKTCRYHHLTPLEGALGYLCSQLSIEGMILGIGSKAEAVEIATVLCANNVPVSFLQELESLETPPWTLIDPRSWRN